MKLGVFGSSFNPPHVGHLAAAEEVRQKLGLDTVVFVPTYKPPHKQVVVSFAHRVAMARLAVRGNHFFRLSLVEKHRRGKSFTVETIKRLRRQFPGAGVFLIMGQDQFADIRTWHNPRELFRLCTAVVIPRPGAPRPRIARAFSHRACYVWTTPIAVSSSELRQRLAAGQSVRYLVPDAVRRYIRRHRLYR